MFCIQSSILKLGHKRNFCGEKMWFQLKSCLQYEGLNEFYCVMTCLRLKVYHLYKQFLYKVTWISIDSHSIKWLKDGKYINCGVSVQVLHT